MKELPVFNEVVCKCDKCVEMCQNQPCSPTVGEAQKLIDAGLANKLSVLHVTERGYDLEILIPSMQGYESDNRIPSSWYQVGNCVFLENNLCVLHDRQLKPIEGRFADCKKKNDKEHKRNYRKLADYLYADWQTQAGKKLLADWKVKVNFK